MMHWHGLIDLFSKHDEKVGGKLRTLSLSSGRYVKFTTNFLQTSLYCIDLLVVGLVDFPDDQFRSATRSNCQRKSYNQICCRPATRELFNARGQKRELTGSLQCMYTTNIEN